MSHEISLPKSSKGMLIIKQEVKRKINWPKTKKSKREEGEVRNTFLDNLFSCIEGDRLYRNESFA